MLEFDYPTIMKKLSHCTRVTCHTDIAPVSEKQYYVNDNFQSERLTSNETEIQGQPEKNSPSAPSLEDQQNNDNLQTERENSQNEPKLCRSTRLPNLLLILVLSHCCIP